VDNDIVLSDALMFKIIDYLQLIKYN